ncbi:MAG TPA: hypothetical protein VFS66_13195 [Acidimicrobiia bacterium]|nr:hypothetical protein [Acidimicrobiia bacterium]
MSPFGDREFRGSIVGGFVTASFLFVVVIGTGQVGSFEALRLIESVLPTARFLGSTAVAAAVTVLTLLLTLIALSMDSQHTFSERLYVRATRITRIAVICMIMGVGVLLAVSIPIAEVAEMRSYYAFLYYLLSAAIAVLGGLVTTMGLMIGTTLRGLIHVAHPEAESDLVEGLPESGS